MSVYIVGNQKTKRRIKMNFRENNKAITRCIYSCCAKSERKNPQRNTVFLAEIFGKCSYLFKNKPRRQSKVWEGFDLFLVVEETRQETYLNHLWLLKVLSSCPGGSSFRGNFLLVSFLQNSGKVSSLVRLLLNF